MSIIQQRKSSYFENLAADLGKVFSKRSLATAIAMTDDQLTIRCRVEHSEETAGVDPENCRGDIPARDGFCATISFAGDNVGEEMDTVKVTEQPYGRRITLGFPLTAEEKKILLTISFGPQTEKSVIFDIIECAIMMAVPPLSEKLQERSFFFQSGTMEISAVEWKPKSSHASPLVILFPGSNPSDPHGTLLVGKVSDQTYHVCMLFQRAFGQSLAERGFRVISMAKRSYHQDRDILPRPGISDDAQDIGALVNHLSPEEPYALIGHSQGGPTVLLAGTQCHPRPEALVFLAGMVTPIPREIKDFPSFRLAAKVLNTPIDGLSQQQTLHDIARTGGEDEFEKYKREINVNWWYSWKDFHDMFEIESDRLIAGFPGNTLIVGCEYDVAAPAETQRALFDRAVKLGPSGNVDIVILPKLDHSLMPANRFRFEELWPVAGRIDNDAVCKIGDWLYNKLPLGKIQKSK